MRRFAEMLAAARNAVFVWSMGLTQHGHGTETVGALINIGLARNYVGREKNGLMPIRGHSGVQGGAEVGCVPSLGSAAAGMREAWGFPVPDFPGWSAAEQVEAARRGEIDVFWIVGNFLDTLPQPGGRGRPSARSAPASTTTSCSRTRCSSSRATSSCSFRDDAVRGIAGAEPGRPRASHHLLPEIPGPRIGRARPEWEVFARWRGGCGRARGKSPNRVVRPVARGDLAEPFLSTPASKGCRRRRLDAMGRTAPVREQRVRTAGEAVSQRRSCRPDGAARNVRGIHPPRKNSSTRWCSARRTL
jgi:hypothetical protein